MFIFRPVLCKRYSIHVHHTVQVKRFKEGPHQAFLRVEIAKDIIQCSVRVYNGILSGYRFDFVSPIIQTCSRIFDLTLASIVTSRALALKSSGGVSDVDNTGSPVITQWR